MIEGTPATVKAILLTIEFVASGYLGQAQGRDSVVNVGGEILTRTQAFARSLVKVIPW